MLRADGTVNAVVKRSQSRLPIYDNARVGCLIHVSRHNSSTGPLDAKAESASLDDGADA